MRVLAIDPGYGKLGVATIEDVGRSLNLIYSACFKTSRGEPHEKRLAAIAEEIKRLIKKFSPEMLAIETIHFSANRKTAIKVAEARGAIMAEAARQNIKIEEFSPQTIKVAVTGYGAASKKQVIAMVERILSLQKGKKREDDEFDAIAIGVACLAESKSWLKRRS